MAVNKNVNSVYFSEKQFKNGEMDKFIRQLNELSYGDVEQQIQILIRPEDCGSYSVDFIQVPWSGEYGGRFEFVDQDQVIMTEYAMPNGIINLYYDEEEYQEQLKEFLDEEAKNNRHYAKNEFGVWYCIEDEQAMEQAFSNVNKKFNLED